MNIETFISNFFPQTRTNMYAQLILSVNEVIPLVTLLCDRIRIVLIPVDPAGDCCYGSSTKPCKSEGLFGDTG